jgi:hypothetical protein
MKVTTAWCSWCYRRCDHVFRGSGWITRAEFRCSECKERTFECRYCRNMAKGKGGWDNELCAEHDGTIASFERLAMRLNDLTDFHELVRRDAWNLKRTGKVLAWTLGGGAIAVPLAVIAAPGIAAALGAWGALGAAGTGTAISTLSGAALTSASLAAIGGGTVAGGMAILTATGTALGAWKGGVITNAYLRDVEGFGITKIEDGTGPWVIAVDGFLTEGDADAGHWLTGLRKMYPRSRVYRLSWESKRLRHLGQLTAGAAGTATLAAFLKKISLQVAKRGATAVTWPTMITGALDNPWHVAMVRAAQTGAVLADLIMRTKEPVPIVLAGHSLGARVVYYALASLARSEQHPRIQDAILLGGAVSRKTEHWTGVGTSVTGRIVNCHSSKDRVLGTLYTAATIFQSDPVGLGPILGAGDNIHNVDLSDVVGGHNEYKPRLRDMAARLMSGAHASGTESTPLEVSRTQP